MLTINYDLGKLVPNKTSAINDLKKASPLDSVDKTTGELSFYSAAKSWETGHPIDRDSAALHATQRTWSEN
jgi:hypothetical protein